jgi:hypothetical protein
LELTLGASCYEEKSNEDESYEQLLGANLDHGAILAERK